MVSFFKSKKTFHSVFTNNSVFNLNFMMVSMENDNNFGYEKIPILVDNMPLRPIFYGKCYLNQKQVSGKIGYKFNSYMYVKT